MLEKLADIEKRFQCCVSEPLYGVRKLSELGDGEGLYPAGIAGLGETRVDGQL